MQALPAKYNLASPLPFPADCKLAFPLLRVMSNSRASVQVMVENEQDAHINYNCD